MPYAKVILTAPRAPPPARAAALATACAAAHTVARAAARTAAQPCRRFHFLMKRSFFEHDDEALAVSN